MVSALDRRGCPTNLNCAFRFMTALLMAIIATTTTFGRKCFDLPKLFKSVRLPRGMEAILYIMPQNRRQDNGSHELGWI